MSARPSLSCLLFLVVVWSPAFGGDEATVTGRVVDQDEKPIADADVGSFWNAERGQMTPFGGVKTNSEGVFEISVKFYGRLVALMALDHDRKRGGLMKIDPKESDKPVTVKVEPLVAVRGEFTCSELGKRPSWTNVYISLDDRSTRVAQCTSEKATFSFKLPPGDYKFSGYGTDVTDLVKDLSLKAGTPELDLKTLDLPATIIAKHIGKEPPPWKVTDARGLSKDVQLADFKGKWVLLEFWGFW